jgi:hypothetical protein
MLTPEKMADLARKGYSTEEVEAVERWVAYCAGLIGTKPEHLEALKLSTRNLSRFAQGEWLCTQRDSEYLPTLWTGQLQGAFPLSEEVAEVFVMLTGDVLLAGADGPQVTANWMVEALEKLADD